MKKGYAVLSALGPDRVGIVRDVTSVIKQFNCNIDESRMISLGGDFSVIMLIDGEQSDIDALLADEACWDPLEEFHVNLKKTTPSGERREGIPYQVKTLSLNNPGVVHAVTNLLRDRGINIHELETDTSSAPFTGSPMFSMRIEFIAESVSIIDELRDELHRIGQEENIDIQLMTLSGNPLD